VPSDPPKKYEPVGTKSGLLRRNRRANEMPVPDSLVPDAPGTLGSCAPLNKTPSFLKEVHSAPRHPEREDVQWSSQHSDSVDLGRRGSDHHSRPDPDASAFRAGSILIPPTHIGRIKVRRSADERARHRAVLRFANRNAVLQIGPGLPSVGDGCVHDLAEPSCNGGVKRMRRFEKSCGWGWPGKVGWWNWNFQRGGEDALVTNDG